MLHLLRLFSWRQARRHPARVLLGAASVVLGVALFVSADVANTTVERAFERTVDRLAGKAKFQVTFASGAGVDEAALRALEAIPGIIAAPIFQRSTTLSELKDGPVLVFGVDFWKDRLLRLYDVSPTEGDLQAFAAAAFIPNGAVVTRRFADGHGLRRGSRLAIDTPGGRAFLTVTGLIENEGPATVFGGNLVVVGLPTAQRMFSRPGLVDRLDVAPPAGMPLEEARSRIAKALGPAYTVEAVGRRSAVLEDALTRVRTFVVVSVVALVVGLFIIYNSVSVSVLERARDMGILRSVGARRRQILSLVVLEWAAVGLVGSALGIAVGYFLAWSLVDVSARSANALTLAIDVQEAVFEWPTAAAALAAGSLVAILAALHPAIEAMRVPPAGLAAQELYLQRRAPTYMRSFIAGLVMMAAGAAPIFGLYLKLPPYAGLAAAVLAFAGLALALPQAIVWTARAARPLFRRLFRAEGFLAADNLAKFPQRTALTAVALGGALSLMVAGDAFQLSLKRSADVWMEEAFPFDLTITGTDMTTQLYSAARFPEALAEELRTVRGVESTYAVSAHYQPFRGNEVALFGIDIDGYWAMHQGRPLAPRMKPLEDPEERRRLVEGGEILVSQNFANRYGVRAGSEVELATAEGPRRFRVLQEIEDYSWPSGVIVMERGHYRRLWKDKTIAYIDVRAAPGTAGEEVKARLAERLRGTWTAFIYSRDDLRRIGLEALDQAFRLADVQIVVAMIIGFLGILNTLLISVLRRTREIGLLRAVGANRGQVSAMVVLEALLLAAGAGAIGVAAGVAGAAGPLRLHMLQLTGYWVPLVVPWGALVGALGLALVIGLAAAFVPARRVARLNVLEAIAYE